MPSLQSTTKLGPSTVSVQNAWTRIFTLSNTCGPSLSLLRHYRICSGNRARCVLVGCRRNAEQLQLQHKQQLGTFAESHDLPEHEYVALLRMLHETSDSTSCHTDDKEADVYSQQKQMEVMVKILDTKYKSQTKEWMLLHSPNNATFSILRALTCSLQPLKTSIFLEKKE